MGKAWSRGRTEGGDYKTGRGGEGIARREGRDQGGGNNMSKEGG